MSGRTGHGISTNGGRRALSASLAVVATLVVLTTAACTPSPGSSIYDGGTYTIDVTVPPQSFDRTFPVPGGLGTCTAAATTPSIHLHGTATLGAATPDPAGGAATIESASVSLPGSTVSAGMLSLTCFGHVVGSIGFSVDFDGAATVRSARLEVATRSVTLTDPSITITNASVVFSGAPAGATPVALDPFTVTVPTIHVTL